MITIAYTTDIVKFYLISSMSGLRYLLSYITSYNTIMHVSINEACEKRNNCIYLLMEINFSKRNMDISLKTCFKIYNYCTIY